MEIKFLERLLWPSYSAVGPEAGNAALRATSNALPWAARVATRLWCGAPILYAMPASRELKRLELCLPRAARGRRSALGGFTRSSTAASVVSQNATPPASLCTPKGYDFADRFALAAAAVASSRPVLLHRLDVLAFITIAILHDNSEAHTGILDITVKPLRGGERGSSIDYRH